MSAQKFGFSLDSVLFLWEMDEVKSLASGWLKVHVLWGGITGSVIRETFD